MIKNPEWKFRKIITLDTIVAILYIKNKIRDSLCKWTPTSLVHSVLFPMAPSLWEHVFKFVWKYLNKFQFYIIWTHPEVLLCNEVKNLGFTWVFSLCMNSSGCYSQQHGAVSIVLITGYNGHMFWWMQSINKYGQNIKEWWKNYNL